MKYAMACKIFFGMKQDQTLAQFMHEIREVKEADKIELCNLLTDKLHETGELSANDKVELS